MELHSSRCSFCNREFSPLALLNGHCSFCREILEANNLKGTSFLDLSLIKHPISDDYPKMFYPFDIMEKSIFSMPNPPFPLGPDDWKRSIPYPISFDDWKIFKRFPYPFTYTNAIYDLIVHNWMARRWDYIDEFSRTQFPLHSFLPVPKEWDMVREDMGFISQLTDTKIDVRVLNAGLEEHIGYSIVRDLLVSRPEKRGRLGSLIVEMYNSCTPQYRYPSRENRFGLEFSNKLVHKAEEVKMVFERGLEFVGNRFPYIRPKMDWSPNIREEAETPFMYNVGWQEHIFSRGTFVRTYRIQNDIGFPYRGREFLEALLRCYGLIMIPYTDDEEWWKQEHFKEFDELYKVWSIDSYDEATTDEYL